MAQDRLYKIFLKMLHQTHDLAETAASLIQRVVGAYVDELEQRGDIPGDLRADVLADLEAETIEMFRKKTYGFYSLREYRESRGRDRR